MKKLGLILVLVMLLVGCGKPAEEVAIPVAIVETEPTPLETFEMSIVTKPISFIEGEFSQAYCDRLKFVGVSYDVRKTDSLVSPLVGSVVYVYHDNNGNYAHDETAAIHYAYQGGVWEYRDMETSSPVMMDTKIGRKVFPAICKIVIGK